MCLAFGHINLAEKPDLYCCIHSIRDSEIQCIFTRYGSVIQVGNLDQKERKQEQDSQHIENREQRNKQIRKKRIQPVCQIQFSWQDPQNILERQMKKDCQSTEEKPED